MDRDPVDLARADVAALGDRETPRGAAHRDPARPGPALAIDDIHQLKRGARQVEERLGGRQAQQPVAEEIEEWRVAVDDDVPGPVQEPGRVLRLRPPLGRPLACARGGSRGVGTLRLALLLPYSR